MDVGVVLAILLVVASGAALGYWLVKHRHRFGETANDRKGRIGEAAVRKQLGRLDAREPSG